MGKGTRIRQERRERQEADRVRARTDLRLTSARAKHLPGHPRRREGFEIVAVTPVRLDDGKMVWFAAPQVVAFNILEAKRLRDLGESQRRAALADLKPRPRKPDDTEQTWQPRDRELLLDAMSNLSAAVLSSFAAIEALANMTIEGLDDGVTYTDRRGEELSPDDMVRWLSIEEKLRTVLPQLAGCPELPKGEEPWQSFRELKKVRDALVHAKRRSYSNTVEDPAVYAKLVRGDGSTCVEDAYNLACKVRPEFFPDETRAELERGFEETDVS